MEMYFQVLKESNRSRFDNYSRQEQCIAILPFGIVACTFFPTTFLEIALYIHPGLFLYGEAPSETAYKGVQVT